MVHQRLAGLAAVFVESHTAQNFDIHLSMRRNIILNYSQQDATFLD
jgi:hypothetical protein